MRPPGPSEFGVLMFDGDRNRIIHVTLRMDLDIASAQEAHPGWNTKRFTGPDGQIDFFLVAEAYEVTRLATE